MHDFDARSVLKFIIEKVIKMHLSLIIFVNSNFLYECLVKLNIIQEKRLMINLMCFRQSYKKQEIAKVK